MPHPDLPVEHIDPAESIEHDLTHAPSGGSTPSIMRPSAPSTPEPDDDQEKHSPTDRVREEARSRLDDELHERGKQGYKYLKNRLSNGAEAPAESAAQTASGAGAQAGAAGAEAGAQAASAGTATTAGTGAAAGTSATGATAATTGAAAGAAAAGEGATIAGAEGAIATVGAASAPETAGVGAVVAVVVGALVIAGAWSLKHWKGVAISILAFFVFGLVGLTYVANIFKPIAVPFTMADKAMSPIKSIVNLRSVKIFAGFAINGSSSATQQVKGKLGELYKAMRDNNFEERVKKTYELSFEKGKETGSVMIKLKGQELGTVKNAEQAFNILKPLPITTEIINNEVRAWNWAEHFKIARQLKSKFDISQLHVPGAETAKNGEDIANVIKYQFSTILGPSIRNMGRVVSCFVTTKSCKPDGSDASGEALAKSTLQDRDESSITKAADTAYNSIVDGIKQDNNYSVTRLDEKVMGNVQALMSSATLPILGWLDFSTAVKEASGNQDYAQIPSQSRSHTAGAIALFEWSTAGQMLAQDFSTDAASVKNRNYTKIEESQAYNYAVYDDTLRGKTLNSDSKINSLEASPMKTFYNAWVSTNSTIINALPILQAWKVIRASALSPFISLAANTPLFSIMDKVISKIPFADKIFGAFVKAPISEIMSTSFGLSTKLLLPIYDPADHTADFGNYMGSGFHVLSKTACESFGCSNNLTAAQTQELRLAHEKYNNEQLASLPLTQRLFAITIPNSFINMAILRSPVKYADTQNAAAAVSGFVNIVKSLPENLAKIYTQPAKAAGADPSIIDGVASNFGISLETLDGTPLSSQIGQDGVGCPAYTGSENICLGDSATTDAWLARYLGYDTAVARGL